MSEMVTCLSLIEFFLAFWIIIYKEEKPLYRKDGVGVIKRKEIYKVLIYIRILEDTLLGNTGRGYILQVILLIVAVFIEVSKEAFIENTWRDYESTKVFERFEGRTHRVVTLYVLSLSLTTYS